jgi:HEAT repeat protein
MAKSRKLEETLAKLAEIRDAPTLEASIATFCQVLKSKQSIAVARAAKMVGEFAIAQLIPELVAAFARMMVNPSATDAGCLAKKEIAEALYRLEYSEEDLFLQGIRHVQMEAVWGGKEDTAAGLRGVCALGLVRMNYPHVMSELADLLADPKPDARIAAARAIAYTRNPEGSPLLRLRVQIGDEPQVLSECLVALLNLAPVQSLPLVKRCLYAREEPLGLAEDVETAEVAALALGETRLPEAFDILRSWWEQVKAPELRRTGLLAIATLRHDAALEFLLSLVAEGKISEAQDAIAALGIYQQDHRLWQRVCQSVEERGNANLLQAIGKQH